MKKLLVLLVNTAMAVGVLIGPATPAVAQTWPTKPIKIVVGFSPGGAADTVTRLMAQQLSEALGQPCVVENKPGASGTIAAELVANAPPDGYTFLLYSDTYTSLPSITKKLRFDPLNSFVPVTVLGRGSPVIVAHPSLSVRSLGELVAYAKANPGKLSYASPAFGNQQHLAMEMLKKGAGIDIVDITYKGGAQSVSDLVGGQVRLGITGIAPVMPHIRSGALVPLAVTSNSRSPLLPDVPTVAEAGFLSIDAVQWQGIVAPAGTPADVISRMHRELLRAMGNPAVIGRLSQIGMDNRTSPTPDDFRQLIEGELARWPAIVKEVGIKAE